MGVLNNPALTLQLGILGKLLGLMGRIVKGCDREVSLAQVSYTLMYVYVAPPTPVGAWSVALGIRRHFEYYCILTTSANISTTQFYKTASQPAAVYTTNTVIVFTEHVASNTTPREYTQDTQ